MSNQACCSHSKVVHLYEDHPGGTRSESWECPDCNTRFWPEGTDMHRRKRRHDFAKAALQGWFARYTPDKGIPDIGHTADFCFKVADAMVKRSEQE